MKWRNHALMAGSIAVMMNLHPLEIFYCAAAANLPDQLEKIGRVRIVGHRTWTHELLLWLAPMLFLLLASSHSLALLPGGGLLPAGFLSEKNFDLRTAILFLPGVLHLAGDVLTPRGIRVAGKKVSLGLFRTGQLTEYLVAALFVILAALYKFGTFGR